MSLTDRTRSVQTAAFLAAILSLAGLASCAGGTSPSLDQTARETLAGPDMAALVVPAAALRHPVLNPVVLSPNLPLGPDQVAIIAVLNNPDLKAARARARIADAQALTAGLLPDPVIGVSGDFRQSGPDLGNGWAAQVGYELTALRDHGLMVKQARAAQAQVRLDLGWQEWLVAGQARILAGRVQAFSRIADLADRTARDAARTLEAAGAAAREGDLKVDDLTAARSTLLEAEDKAAQGRRDLLGARLDLNALLGLKPQTQLSLVAGAPRQPLPDPEVLFAAASTRRLDLLALRAGYDSQSVALRKAVRDRFPSLQLGLARATDTANNQTLGPSIALSLPLWNRNRGAIAEAAATRDALRSDYAARLFQTRSDITELVQMIAISRRQRDAEADKVAALQRHAEASDVAAARGDLSQSAARATRQAARDRLASLITLDQSLLEQTVSLELATGGPLP